MKTLRLLLALGLCFGHAAAAEMVLVEKGASLSAVIVPENPTMFTKLAAQELADYLGRIGGAKGLEPDEIRVEPTSKQP